MAAPPNPNRGLLIAVIAVGGFLLLAVGLLVGLLVTRSSSTVATSSPATTIVVRGTSSSTSSSSSSSTTTSSTSTTTTSAPSTTTTTPAPATTSAPTTAVSGGSLSQTCIADSIGLRVRYPAGWETSTGPDIACMLFDPEPFTVVPQSEAPIVAVFLSPREGDLPTAVEQETNSEFAIIESQESMALGGRDAVCVLMTATGLGLLEPGTRMYLCLVDIGGRVVVVGSHRPPDFPAIDYDARVRDMAAAVESF